jgi:UDP-N-acetylglucosamine 2-epimerase (non-hydrolysing)
MRQEPETFVSRLIVTAQHREILDQVLVLFDLRPDYDLDIMRPDQNPFDVTASVLLRLQSILEAERPDLVIVQGDATSAFAGALAAFYLKIPVAHVEAGLRTDDRYQPFPEEVNRRLVTTLAEWHFAPTEHARHNLLREGVRPDRIFVTGNTVIDALLMIANQSLPPLSDVIANLVSGQRLLLVTTHRRESWGQPIRRICQALCQITEQFPEVVVAFSVHPNPNVRAVVHDALQGVARVHLLEPIAYPHFVHLMARAEIILTDSGGIQEEAPSFGKPVLVLREVTERPEGVRAGVLKVVGTDPARIVGETTRLLNDPTAYQQMAQRRTPYGDGQATQRILQILRHPLPCAS